MRRNPNVDFKIIILESVTLMDGTPITFELRGQRLILRNLPQRSPDPSGVTIIRLSFDQKPVYHAFSYYPQLHEGKGWTAENTA